MRIDELVGHENMDAAGHIVSGKSKPHPYTPIHITRAGASSLRRGQSGISDRAGLGTTRSKILIPFDHPQSAIEGRCYDRTGVPGAKPLRGTEHGS